MIKRRISGSSTSARRNGLLALLLTMCCSCPLFGKQPLPQENNTDEQLSHLFQLAQEFLDRDINQALQYSEQGVALARTKNHRKWEAKMLAQNGLLNSKAGHLEKALRNLLLALSISDSLKDDQVTASCLHNLGMVYGLFGRGEKALDYLFRALKIREIQEDGHGIAQTHTQIGQVYYDLGRYDTAIDHYQKSLTIQTELEDEFGITKTLSNVGYALFQQGNYQEALQYQLKAKKKADYLNFDTGTAYAANNIGDVLRMLGSYEEALKNHRLAREICQRIGDRQCIAQTTNNIGITLGKLGRYDAAVAELERGSQVARDLNSTARLKESHEYLSVIYREMGKAEKALEHFKAYIQYKDVLLDEEMNRQITEVQVRYELEKKQREIALLTKDKSIQELRLRRQALVRNSSLIVTILAIVVALLVYARYRGNLKSHQILAQKNLEIEKANREIQLKNSKLARAYTELESLAGKDPLTLVSNRRQVLKKIQAEAVRTKRMKAPFTLVLADIDDFKTVNDRFGHDTGDFVLKKVAATMRDMIRSMDVVARWGGEEFLLFLPENRRRRRPSVGRENPQQNWVHGFPIQAPGTENHFDLRGKPIQRPKHQ